MEIKCTKRQNRKNDEYFIIEIFFNFILIQKESQESWKMEGQRGQIGS